MVDYFILNQKFKLLDMNNSSSLSEVCKNSEV